MSLCEGCQIDLTGYGSAGSQGATGADGADGVAVVFAYQSSNGTYLSTTAVTTWTSLASYTIPAATLTTDGSFLEMFVFATGGTSTIVAYDGLRINLNGANLTNPDASYLTITSETYHFPYASSNKPMEIRVKLVRHSSTTGAVYLFMTANSGASRIDLYSAVVGVNNWTSSSNTLSIDAYNGASASSIRVYDVKGVKYLK